MQAKKRYFILVCSLLLLLTLYVLIARPLLLQSRRNPNTSGGSIARSYLSRGDLLELEKKYEEREEDDTTKCRMETCFNFKRCNKFKVYVYPLDEILVGSHSYKKILQTIKESGLYTDNPAEACLFVLSLDTLDRDPLSQDFIRNMQYRVEKLEHWNNGENHVIFNLYSGTWPHYTEDLGFNIGRAILAKASIALENYRPKFDISLPLFHKTHPERGGEPGFLRETLFPGVHQYFLAFKGKRYVYGIGSETRNSLYHLHNGQDLALVTTCKHGKNWREMQDDRCEMDNSEYDRWDYVNLLSNSTFCLVPRGRRLGSFRFLETLQAGCVPVILSNSWQLPFAEVIDWTAATVSIDERHLLQVPEILRMISQPQILKMRQQTQMLWDLYLSSVRKIVLTTLQIIKQRIHPHSAATSIAWNNRPGVFFSSSPAADITPTAELSLLVNMSSTADISGAASQLEGPSAIQSESVCVVLSTENSAISSNSNIFKNIYSVSQNNCTKEIVVIWRSSSPPPPLSDWYRFGKLNASRLGISLVLSNLTKPSKFKVSSAACRSENILTLDDDVTISTEEVEFMHSVFRDFPDRLVGFTPRLHYWDGDARAWRYSSKASSQFSMIGTEAAMFARKYSRLLYEHMPRRTLQYLDQFWHCQDILFNFLLAQVTKKAPIKVTQRKQMSSLTLGEEERLNMRKQFKEKQECMARFVDDLGEMPLIVSQLRMDPVLFKDPVSALRKKYTKMELLV